MTAKQLQDELRALGNPADAAFLSRFFKTGPGQYGEGDLFAGVRVPVLRKLARKYRGLPLKQAESLLHSKLHEERLTALLILVLQAANAELRKPIYELYIANTDYVNNWDLVDLSAPHLVGVYLADKSRRPLYRMARSPSLWQRRISILATFRFIRMGDFDDTLKIAEILLGDREDLIHKAVGWMLREVGNRQLAVEEAFLRQHCRAMPRTMLRYAIEKFPEKKRKAYLRATGCVDYKGTGSSGCVDFQEVARSC